jgi:hypothetical protein
MAATVEIDELNGVGGDITHDIDNSNMGSSDAPNLDAADNPVIPGANTYEKYQKLHVTNMGASSKIKNIKIWRTGALGGDAVHLTNARIADYGGAEDYAQPVATDSEVATQAMPTAEPASANLGIGGVLAGELEDVGSSDALVHQIQTDATDTAGSASTINYQYDEIA